MRKLNWKYSNARLEPTLIELRWAGNIVSPYGVNNKVKVTNKEKTQWRDTVVNKNFNVRTGTILGHSKLDYRTWIHIVDFLIHGADNPNDISKAVKCTPKAVIYAIKRIDSILENKKITDFRNVQEFFLFALCVNVEEKDDMAVEKEITEERQINKIQYNINPFQKQRRFEQRIETLMIILLAFVILITICFIICLLGIFIKGIII